MIQCDGCEYFRLRADGTPQLTCDPYSTVKEPECLAKWQVMQLALIAQSHEATLNAYRRFAPLQEKMLRHVEREIDEAEEADRWKDPDDGEAEDDPFRL